VNNFEKENILKTFINCLILGALIALSACAGMGDGKPGLTDADIQNAPNQKQEVTV